MTRRLLFEAASVIMYRSRVPLGIRDWAERIAARSGSWKARVALARKLAAILFVMMRDSRVPPGLVFPPAGEGATPRLAFEPPGARRNDSLRPFRLLVRRGGTTLSEMALSIPSLTIRC